MEERITKFNYGRWLKDQREKKEMLAEELARKSGLTAVSISRYENGRRVPNVRTAMEICKALNLDSVKPEDFEYLEDDVEAVVE